MSCLASAKHLYKYFCPISKQTPDCRMTADNQSHKQCTGSQFSKYSYVQFGWIYICKNGSNGAKLVKKITEFTQSLVV